MVTSNANLEFDNRQPRLRLPKLRDAPPQYLVLPPRGFDLYEFVTYGVSEVSNDDDGISARPAKAIDPIMPILAGTSD